MPTRHVHVGRAQRMGSAAIVTDPMFTQLLEHDHMHLSESTIDQAIGELTAAQVEYLKRLDAERAAAQVDYLRQLDTPVQRRRPALVPQPARTRRPRRALTRHQAVPDGCPDGVHPLAWAECVKRAEGDLRRIEVLGPNRIKVLNRPAP